MPHSFRYNGRNVIVAKQADIPRFLRIGGRHASLVQRLLDQTEPWERGEDPIEQSDFPHEFDAPTIRRSDLPRGVQPFWAQHAGHSARQVYASPFAQVRASDRDRTSLITIELAGTPHSPWLVRAHPGDYQPPLPWMNSARNADGGVDACYDYWRDHVFVVTSNGLLRGGTLPPPQWWTHRASPLSRR